MEEKIISEEQLEIMRHKARKRQNIAIVLTFLAFVLYIGMFYVALIEKEGMSALFVAKIVVAAVVLAVGTLGVLGYLLVRHAYDKFNFNYKSKYVTQVLNGISGFEGLEYHPEGGFTWDEIRNAAVVACGEKKYFESEDQLFGEYEHVKFRISDVVTKKLVRRDGKTKTEEIFGGQVICLLGFDDLKVSKGHIQIFEKEFLSNFAGWKAEHQIQTENEAFQSRFRVYADDEHNAYYILTPQRIEKIMEFADAVDGQISLVFYDEKLFAAVKRESMFDAVMDEPVSKQTEYILEDADFIQKAKGILIAS